MSVAFWLIRMHRYGHSDLDEVHLQYIMYWVLCGSLSLWSWFYFRLEWYRWSVFWILVCLGQAIATCWSFFHINTVAGWLLVPLCIWILYATAINIAGATHYAKEFARDNAGQNRFLVPSKCASGTDSGHVMKY